MKITKASGTCNTRPVFISSRLPNIPLFELSWSQIIQLICVIISPKLQLAGYLVEIIIPRYLGLVCKYPANCPRRPHQPEDSHYAWTLSKISQANSSSLSFKVKSRADEGAICNFGIISQIRNSGIFGNLKLMMTGYSWESRRTVGGYQLSAK